MDNIVNRSESVTTPATTPAERDGRIRGTREVLLSHDAIVQSALDLSEREGPAALSLRRLGKELGVDATAFYRYFRGKDELILACMNRVVAIAYDDIADRADSLDWPELLRAVADKSWQVSLAYPAIYSLAFARTTGGSAEQKMVELLLSRLSALGLDKGATVLFYRSYVDALLSLCGANATVLRLGPETAAKDATAWSRIYAVLPEATYPAARAHATELAAVTDRMIFDSVIDAVIEAISRALPDARG